MLDDRPELPRFDRRTQLVEQASVAAIEQDPVQRDVPVERQVEVARQLDDRRGASAFTHPGEAVGDADAADEIGDGVELSAGVLLRGRERIGLAIVDRSGCAQLEQELVVSSASKRDRLSTARRDQLNGEDANPAAGTVDQHAFSGLDMEASIDHRVRRSAGKRHRGRLGVREIRRLARDRLGIGDMEFSVGALSASAEGGGAEHLVTALPFADVRSDGVDHPGEVGTDDRRQAQAGPGAVGAVGGVDRVDRGRMDGNPNLARSRDRVGNLHQLEHLGAAEATSHNRAHWEIMPPTGFEPVLRP